MYKAVALIPARSGSKRIKDKNPITTKPTAKDE
jgi:CMP-N-acetylneuraminic acid synthetase